MLFTLSFVFNKKCSIHQP